MARRVLRDCLTVRSLGGAFVRAVLVEHRLRDCLCGVKLLVACAFRACKFVARTCGRDCCVCRVRLLLHVACVDHHEHVARADVCADVHVARENLSADLKGESRLVASAYRARVTALRGGGIADRHRPYERRRCFLCRVRAAARECCECSREDECEVGTRVHGDLSFFFSNFLKFTTE